MIKKDGIINFAAEVEESLERCEIPVIAKDLQEQRELCKLALWAYDVKAFLEKGKDVMPPIAVLGRECALIDLERIKEILARFPEDAN